VIKGSKDSIVLGSGFVAFDSLTVLTCWHVVKGKDDFKFYVKHQDSTLSFDIEVVKTFPENDIASY
jgi:hypothetical protein